MSVARPVQNTGKRIAALATSVAFGLPLIVGTSPAQAQETDRETIDHVLYWNEVALEAFRETGGTPGPLSRGGAMMNLAIYDVVNSIRPIGEPYLGEYGDLVGERDGALNAAIDHAAHNALSAAFPRLDFSDDLATARALPDEGSAEDRRLGREAGELSAAAIVQDREGDGSQDTIDYVPVLEPGHWRPAPGVPAAGAHWGGVRPFVLESGDQFRPDLPGGFDTLEALLASDFYADQVAEVHELGGADSTTRTEDQTEIARFWANDLDGTYKPVGHQYELARILIETHQPDATSYDTALLFTLQSVAMADASIAVWDSKYETDVDLWRPEHAIALADTDGNPLTEADPDWRTLSADVEGNSFSPSFPSYVSGHSGIAAAWGGAVIHYFGEDDLPFVATTEDPNTPGVTRYQPSISASVQEKADSRLYAGVHYSMDNDDALELGYALADYVTDHLG
ncbi:vanadium-dependent haloperoxidase [Nocardiopsis alba]|uniref:vanadium-dependent haloperoxidase n=2 Tax=Nocardiopsis alba TaxID=53437 RepID=UPI0033A67D79